MTTKPIYRDYMADAIREQEWPPIAGGEEPEESDAAIIALIRRAAENDGCLDEIAPADALRLCDLAEEAGRPNEQLGTLYQAAMGLADGERKAIRALEQASEEVARLRFALKQARVEHKNGPGEQWVCDMGLCPLCQRNAAIDAALAGKERER